MRGRQIQPPFRTHLTPPHPPTHPYPPTHLPPKQVKTARACQDYRKEEFPHATARITELRYIGAVTAEKLKAGARRHLGAACPVDSVTTVADMRALLQTAAVNA